MNALGAAVLELKDLISARILFFHLRSQHRKRIVYNVFSPFFFAIFEHEEGKVGVAV